MNAPAEQKSRLGKQRSRQWPFRMHYFEIRTFAYGSLFFRYVDSFAGKQRRCPPSYVIIIKYVGVLE
uniref:Uncharacterized protein n=1 Tax=Candidatus Kentrum sp. DK TaxID=2126562 RepID=A0A450T7S9_9GAMM|nr:MAG: hypothetical protein BECKDK2373C_GA0170839_10992 [Candidatus Kentron sp. DK]